MLSLVDCTAAKNSSPNPGRWLSYHRKASSISAAAAGRTTMGITGCGYESGEAPLPTECQSGPHDRVRRAVDPTLRAARSSVGPPLGLPRDSPKPALEAAAVPRN